MSVASSNASGFWVLLTIDVLFGILFAYHAIHGADILWFGVLLCLTIGVIMVKAGP
jgi:hypothetical protein